MRFLGLFTTSLLTVLLAVAGGLTGSAVWIALAVLAAVLTLVGVYDLGQRRHSILRNYPILGHFRFIFEAMRPEMQQYFIERNTDGRPYDRATRTAIYQRAKGLKDEIGFGSEREVNEPGYEWLLHSLTARDPPTEEPRVRVGGPDCTKPYDMALLNVSGMSFERSRVPR